jgi:hypothetical protein
MLHREEILLGLLITNPKSRTNIIYYCSMFFIRDPWTMIYTTENKVHYNFFNL